MDINYSLFERDGQFVLDNTSQAFSPINAAVSVISRLSNTKGSSTCWVKLEKFTVEIQVPRYSEVQDPFTLSVSVDSCVDISINAWKEYIGFNCTIHTKHQH